MTYPRDIETPSARQLFENGYEHIADSMRLDTTDSPRERAESAHRGAMLISAAHAAALIDLVEAQRAANAVAAFRCIGAYGDNEYFAARDRVRALLGLTGGDDS